MPHWAYATARKFVEVFNAAFCPSSGTGDDHRTALGAADASYILNAWSARAPSIAQVLAENRHAASKVARDQADGGPLLFSIKWRTGT